MISTTRYSSNGTGITVLRTGLCMRRGTDAAVPCGHGARPARFIRYRYALLTDWTALQMQRSISDILCIIIRYYSGGEFML